MSTPFPLEERSQLERPTGYYDPWKGPPPPRWYAGMGFNEDTAYLGPLYRALEATGEGAAKGEELMAGTWHTAASGLAAIGEAVHAPAAPQLRELERTAADFQADAAARVKALTPDAATTGAAVQTIHGLVSGAYRMGVGALAGGPVGGAALLGATETASRYRELREQGVDDFTARRAALLSGALSGAGGLMPAAYGTTLLARLGTGAAANMGFGLVNRYGDHALLDDAGYHDMADQQRVLDATQLLTDGLLGAAFGGIAHLHAGKPGQGARDVPGVEDAALTANLALRDRALAPGVPVDPAAANAHDAALRTATQALLQGRPVNVAGTGVEASTFARRPPPNGADAQALLLHALSESPVLQEESNLAALEEALGARLRGEKPPEPAPAAAAPAARETEIPRNKSPLNTAQRAMETRFAEQLGGNLDEAERQYSALPDSAGGKVLNTDTARELSADYLADRTQSAAVHEPASWLVKQLYARRLAEAPKAGEENTVLFTGGGTGAGKSTAVKGVLGEEAERAQIVYDTNMGTAKSAIGKIDQALAAGKNVRIAYVYREPIEALRAGALKRAMRQEGEFGSGRAVPIEEHLGTHVGSNEAIRQIALHYAHDPRVDVRIIDNSRGANNARLIALEHLPRIDYNLTREQAHQTLESEFAGGRISAAIYRGFTGREPTARPEPERPGPAAAGAGLGPAAGGQPQPQRAGERPDQLESVSTAAGRRIEVQPKIVEASSLLTSDHPEYPQELQPRQRGARVALAEQVRGIAKNLEPERLGSSPEADRGAPITGPDQVVESGNGRVMALRDVYANNPEKAKAYRAFLESQGHDLTGFKEPVLVRERVTPMTDAERRAFTVEANQAATAALSPVERAQADSPLMDAATLSQLRGGDIATAQNAPFVRAFLTQIPEGERNALVNPDGTVSQEGVRRLQAAILAKAYGGAPESNATLGRMLESTDSDMRSALGGMLDAAPAFAKLRQGIEEGKVGPEYDLSKALTQAIEQTARLRGAGQALAEFLKQQDFLTARAPVVDALMRALYDKKGERLAAREKIAQRLMNYADQALKQRLDQGMLFGDAPLRPEQLLAEPKEEAATPMRPAGDMFGLRTPQGKAKPAEGAATAVAQQVLDRTPNLEVPDENGEAARARAELMAAEGEAQLAQERAPGAMETAANCAGQRAA